MYAARTFAPTVTEKLQALLFADVSTAVHTTDCVVLGKKNLDSEGGSHETVATATLSVASALG